jgi:glycosyltransferase involved in cell wall biosynthesis
MDQTTPPAAPSPARLRVVIQQPALAKYRVPVFRELARRPGLDVHLVFADDGKVPNVEAEDFRATFVPLKTWRGPGPQVFWHAAQTRYADPAHADVLVLTWNTRYLSLAPALRKARRRGVGTVLWGHGESKRERGWATWLRRRVMGKASATLFYTRTMADRAIAAGADPGRIFVAPNSIDQGPIAAAQGRFLGEPGALARVRGELGLTAGRTILFVSRLERLNNLHLLLEAAAALASDLPGLRVLVVGKGEDGARLERLCETMGLGRVVTFLGAIYEEDRLAPLFCAADVFAYPSNMGLSLLHAFGYGLPVVTGDNRRLHGPEIEALRHEVNGLEYPHDDVGGLTAALRRVLTDEALRQRLGEAARRTVAGEYSLGNMVDGMEAAIRFAARERGRGGRIGGSRASG